MKRTTRVVLCAAALAFVCIGVFAVGTKETGAAGGAAAAAAGGGKLQVYNTPADYEKATGRKIRSYGEAPALKALVSAGKLPAVEKRMPAEPVVVSPLEEIGKYGGDLIVDSLGPDQGWDAYPVRIQRLFKLAPDLATVAPNIAKGWTMSDDGKTLTIQLREGMKWSDGAPFTADDIMFWYKDIVLNEKITPVKPRTWSPGGQMAKVEKLDDTTVRMQFAAPYPPIIARLALQDTPFAPAHYLKKWHADYNTQAEQVAKQEGFDGWWKAFAFHFASWSGNPENRLDPNLPGLDSWVVTKITTEEKVFERNPYFWKVDTAGNQLPYADRQVVRFYSTPEMINLKAIAGELTYTTFVLYLKDYPLYKENEKKGDYRVTLWQNSLGSNLGLGFNVTHKDPVLRAIFADVRFRQAMSLAINRDEINKVFFYGRGTPRQATTTPDTSFYEDWMGKYFVEYDADRANKLLDEIGLKWDQAHKVRLRSDGQPFSLTIEYTPAEAAPEKPILELIREYWGKVGVQAAIKEEQRNLYNQRGNANEFDASSFQFGGNGGELQMYISGAPLHRPAWGVLRIGTPWENWYNTRARAAKSRRRPSSGCSTP